MLARRKGIKSQGLLGNTTILSSQPRRRIFRAELDILFQIVIMDRSFETDIL